MLVDAVGSEGGESGGGIGDGGGSDGGGGDFNVGVGVDDVDDRIRVLGKTNMLRPAHPEINVHLLGRSHHAKAQPRSGLQRRSPLHDVICFNTQSEREDCCA